MQKDMIAEDTEFLISQYADDTLSPAERATVDALLASDASARQLLEEYRDLDVRLSGLRPASPAVQWDKFSQRISLAIDESDAEFPAVAGRIGFGAWAGQLRIAAAVLIGVTVGIVVLHHGKPAALVPLPSPAVNHQAQTEFAVQLPAAPVGITDVRGPEAEVAAGTASEDISVGPSRLAASEGVSKYADQMIVPGASKVVITEAIGIRAKEKHRPH